MSLADGNYITIQEHVVDALEADTGAGGLVESPNPSVKTIEAELRDEPRAYRSAEVPAIAVSIVGMNESREAGATKRTYRLVFYIYTRGADSESEIETCQKIAHRLEALLREENAPDKQFGNLCADIPGALGSLTVTVSQTQFVSTPQEGKGQKTYGVMGIVSADIEIPCSAY